MANFGKLHWTLQQQQKKKKGSPCYVLNYVMNSVMASINVPSNFPSISTPENNYDFT